MPSPSTPPMYCASEWPLEGLESLNPDWSTAYPNLLAEPQFLFHDSQLLLSPSPEKNIMPDTATSLRSPAPDTQSSDKQGSSDEIHNDREVDSKSECIPPCSETGDEVKVKTSKDLAKESATHGDSSIEPKSL